MGYSGMGSGGVRPSGTVTFLFTDIEGSTKRWEADPDTMRIELAAHDDVLRAAVEARVVGCSSTPVTGCVAAFQSARAAVDAAVGRSEGWGCRCGWGSRRVRPSCVVMTISGRR